MCVPARLVDREKRINMCNFFSFVTCPSLGFDKYYFDWAQRKADRTDGMDSHAHICAHYKLNEDICNKYEYNPLTGKFLVDMLNARDDSGKAGKWVKTLDWQTIVEPLIIKPIINPFHLPKVERPTLKQLGWLEEWASVRDSAWTSVRDSVWNSVGNTVGDSVRDSVGDSVGDSVWAYVRDTVRASVGDSVGAYVGSFFDVQYDYDFSSAAKLWAEGLVPSYDGTTWRLHSGGKAEVVYEQKGR